MELKMQCEKCATTHQSSALLDKAPCECYCHDTQQEPRVEKKPRSVEYTPGQVLSIAERAIKALREDAQAGDEVLHRRIVALEKGYGEIYSQSTAGGRDMNFIIQSIMQDITKENAAARKEDQIAFEDSVLALMKKYKVLKSESIILANL